MTSKDRSSPPNSNPLHLFAYGSLMFEPVWSKVVKGNYQAANARAHGFRRTKIHNEVYPALIPGTADDYVDGIIYFDVKKFDIHALDIFEGEEYRRDSINCDTALHGTLSAQTYIFKEDFRDKLIEKEWDPQWFLHTGLHAFIRQYRGMR